MSTLRDPAWCAINDLRTNASAFLANMCQPDSNKKLIVDSNIVRELFYDKDHVPSTLPIRMVRRLISNTTNDNWIQDMITPDTKTGVPSFKDIMAKLPDQNAMQDELQTAVPNGDGLNPLTPPAQSPNQQLTRDIGHIYVDLRRHTRLISQSVTTKLIWCLVNLILIGMRTRNALDTSDGVFGLGLALQNDGAVVESLALEAIEALRCANGFVILKQVIEMGKGDAAQVAKKVAENATNVLNSLVAVAERTGIPEDVLEAMREALRLGLEIKLESESQQ
jgi:hypothetical protein